MWPWHSSTVQQTSASFTDQKLRKENTIFQTIHLLTAETDVVYWCCISICASEIRPVGKDPFWLPEMLTSTLPVVLLVLKLRLFIWNIYSSVFSTVFSFAKVEKSFLYLLQIVDIPYWILRLRYGESVKHRNCILSFHDRGLSSPCPLF